MALIEELKPDREKLAAYDEALLAVPVPDAKSYQAISALGFAATDLEQLASFLESFGEEGPF